MIKLHHLWAKSGSIARFFATIYGGKNTGGGYLKHTVYGGAIGAIGALVN